MTTDGNRDVLLLGGPRDGEFVRAAGAAVVELEIGGFFHRYVLTDQQRERDGVRYAVFNYDGEVDSVGAVTDPGSG